MATHVRRADPSALKLARLGAPMDTTRRLALAGPFALLTAAYGSSVEAAHAAALATDSKAALERLYSTSIKARDLGKKARAILVFPRILKAGLVVGGQGGEGALIEKGRAVAFYNAFSGSYGFQAGAQAFSYALFFMTQSALDYLKKSHGWSIGTGPNVVIIDAGAAKSMTTTTAPADIYAFVYGQKGLMAGISLEGSKITQIHPDP